MLFPDQLVVAKLREGLGQNAPIVKVRTMLSSNIITTFPDHVKIIMATNPENFVKGEGLELLNW